MSARVTLWVAALIVAALGTWVLWDAGRFQLSPENAKSVRVPTPRPGAASTTLRTARAPRRWPAARGRPRAVAQRPLPSMMMAT